MYKVDIHYFDLHVDLFYVCINIILFCFYLTKVSVSFFIDLQFNAINHASWWIKSSQKYNKWFNKERLHYMGKGLVPIDPYGCAMYKFALLMLLTDFKLWV